MVKKLILVPLGLIVLTVLFRSEMVSQNLAFDGKAGLSFLTGNGSSSGLLLGGAFDIPLDKGMFVRPELNITTSSGTPIEIAGEIKYNLPSSETRNQVYLDGGLGLWFHSGGSALGLDFGAGMIFPIHGSNLSVPLEFRLGPVFDSGNTVLQVAITSGIRIGTL